MFKGINEYEFIEINSFLSYLLDMYFILDEVKIVCFIIDILMCYLDVIGDNYLFKKVILIGDLLSVYFYILLVNI